MNTNNSNVSSVIQDRKSNITFRLKSLIQQRMSTEKIRLACAPVSDHDSMTLSPNYRDNLPARTCLNILEIRACGLERCKIR